MKKILLLLTIAVLGMSSCKKDDPQPEKECKKGLTDAEIKQLFRARLKN